MKHGSGDKSVLESLNSHISHISLSRACNYIFITRLHDITHHTSHVTENRLRKHKNISFKPHDLIGTKLTLIHATPCLLSCLQRYSSGSILHTTNTVAANATNTLT